MDAIDTKNILVKGNDDRLIHVDVFHWNEHRIELVLPPYVEWTKEIREQILPHIEGWKMGRVERRSYQLNKSQSKRFCQRLFWSYHVYCKNTGKGEV